MSPIIVLQIQAIFVAFATYLASEEVRCLARKNKGDFTRARGKIPLPRLLQFLIFRHCKDTPSELSSFYKSIDASEEQPSRQAMNARLRHLNPDVWPLLSKKFADLCYASSAIIRKTKNYLIWATDSTSAELPYSKEAAEKYGIHKSNHSKKESSNGKVIVRCGGLYDVINRFFVDYVIKPFKESEMAIILQQIRSFAYLLTNHKIIILADRGYASLQFMILMDKLGYKFCVRVTKNTYKSAVKAMSSNDEYIEIKLTKTVLSRFTDPEVLAYVEGMPTYRVRVVKRLYTNPKTGAQEWEILFTNLPASEFKYQEMLDLYTMRWNIEVAYYTLKVELELERHVSVDPDIAINILYGKIAFYNFSAIFREQLDLVIANQEIRNESESNGEKKNKYKYQTNIKALLTMLYDQNLVQCLISNNNINELIAAIITLMINQKDKMKTAIRPDRHYDRWGKPVTCSYKYKFKIDGRNHPKVAMVGGTLRTVKP